MADDFRADAPVLVFRKDEQTVQFPFSFGGTQTEITRKVPICQNSAEIGKLLSDVLFHPAKNFFVGNRGQILILVDQILVQLKNMGNIFFQRRSEGYIPGSMYPTKPRLL